MRVFSVPLSAPFLRTVIAALVDGRLVVGFDARNHPEKLAQATLYLPTRRAGRMKGRVSASKKGITGWRGPTQESTTRMMSAPMKT